MTLPRDQEVPEIEETSVGRFFWRIFKGDIISDIKCQDTIYQRT